MSLTKKNHVETPEEAKAKYRRFCSRLIIWLLKHDSKIDDIDLVRSKNLINTFNFTQKHEHR